jgi:hypothetical protein
MLPKVVDESNVLLLILNARDPAGSHSWLVEEELCRREAKRKRLVFVLNKIGTVRVHLLNTRPVLLWSSTLCCARRACVYL